MSHPNDEAMEALLPLMEAFGQLGVKYYIGGSLASCAFGIARSTIDVDVVADLHKRHVQPFVSAVQGRYYVDADSIHQAISLRSGFNLIYLAQTYKVDVFVPKQRPMDRSAMQRITHARLDEDDPSTELPFASPEDIILNKLEWYRMGDEVSERQWLDVVNVMKVQGDALDRAYMGRWAPELRVSDLLGRALREAGL